MLGPMMMAIPASPLNDNILFPSDNTLRSSVSCSCIIEQADDSSFTVDNMALVASPLAAPHQGPCLACGHMGYIPKGPRPKRARSAEFEDLPLISPEHRSAWSWTPPPFLKDATPLKKAKVVPYATGQSPLERTPPELLEMFLEQVRTQPGGSLVSSMLISKSMLHAATPTTYKRAHFSNSFTFFKFLSQLERTPSLGELVQRLDFSQFTSVGLGRSQKASSEVQMLTATTLLRCLKLTPNLREFLAQQHLDSEIDAQVLRFLLLEAPRLEALDFCAASSASFLRAVDQVIGGNQSLLPDVLPIRRLGLHECVGLPTQAFKMLLPRLARLNRLDVAHTTIDGASLQSIPRSARLTHLNVARCPRLKGNDLVDFLINHPAASSLVHLNIAAEPSQYSGISAEALSRLLPQLPRGLISLNLGGNAVDGQHIGHLQLMSSYLEELGLAHSKLSTTDLQSLLPSDITRPHEHDGERSTSNMKNALRFLDAAGIPHFKVLQLRNSSDSILKRPFTTSIQVLEVDDAVANGWRPRSTDQWMLNQIGRRNYLVKLDPTWQVSEKRTQSDQKSRFWGCHKTPMCDAKLGGIYAHYSAGVK